LSLSEQNDRYCQCGQKFHTACNTDMTADEIFSVHHTHTHTHPFNDPFYGTTRVSHYQKGKTNLDFTEARDSFLQAGCPSCRPTNSVEALKG